MEPVDEYLEQFCIFCYKVVDENVEFNDNDSNGLQSVKRFCKFLGRLSYKKSNISITQQVATCEACVKIVDSFNDLYHQIQCLQLQLGWQLQKLKGVITCADKIPARCIAFQKRYQVQVPARTQETSASDDANNMLMEIRNQITLQVARYISNTFPRVGLDNHVSQENKLSNHLLPSLTASPSPPLLNQCDIKFKPCDIKFEIFDTNNASLSYNYLLGWITTFIAVVVCYFPNDSYYNSLHTSLAHAPLTQGINQAPEEFSCFTESSSVVTDSNNVVATTEGNQCHDSLSSVSTSPTNHDSKCHVSPKTEPCDQLDMCNDSNVTFNDQTVGTDPLTAVQPQSQSQLTHHIQNYKPIPAKTSLVQNTTPSIQEVSNASDHISCKTSIYAPTLFYENGNINRDLNHVQLPNAQSVQHFPKIKITETTQSNTTPLSVNAAGNQQLANKVRPTSKQLRAKFKCARCNKTFSSLPRLDTHKASCALPDLSELDEEDNAVTELSNDENDGDYVSAQKLASDEESEQYISENSSLELSSTEEETSSEQDSSEEDIEFDKQNCPPMTLRRSPMQISKVPLIKPNYQMKHQTNKSFQELIRTYKDSNGQIELSQMDLAALKLNGANVRLKDSKLSLQMCKIGGCEPSLFSNDDLENHQRLHGDFKCSFCEYYSNFAPAFIAHELEHNSDKQDISCSKCLNVKIDRLDYKTHFLKNHLAKRVDLWAIKCPVCYMTFPDEDQVPLTHFFNQHDLNRLSNSITSFECPEEKCSAYFLTRQQMIVHGYTIHNKKKLLSNDGKLDEECVFQCAFCSKKFCFKLQLVNHQKVCLSKTKMTDTVGNINESKWK